MRIGIVVFAFMAMVVMGDTKDCNGNCLNGKCDICHCKEIKYNVVAHEICSEYSGWS